MQTAFVPSRPKLERLTISFLYFIQMFWNQKMMAKISVEKSHWMTQFSATLNYSNSGCGVATGLLGLYALRSLCSPGCP
jgi:hypothetical protein